jgi:hypothetical protein
MLDLDTFVTYLYVLVDDLCKQLPVRRQLGRPPSLSTSEIVTLALISQWGRFFGERDFYRCATCRLRPLFPTLPHRAQLNRLIRADHDTIARVAVALAQGLGVARAPYEILDCTAAPTRNAKRWGRSHLAGVTAIGHSNRLGWYEGFRLLLAVSPEGVITGYGFGPANVNDRALAAALLTRRDTATPCPGAGWPAQHGYLADAGFCCSPETSWEEPLTASILATPQPRTTWSRPQRRLHASLRQMVETVNGRLLSFFRLERDRPHALAGFAARLAAKVALHNACITLNRLLNRPPLAFADLVGW